jgi:hypothetical protein
MRIGRNNCKLWRRLIATAPYGVAIIFECVHTAALGAEHVAMVMEIEGETNPAVREGDLIDQGKAVTLGQDARLIFFVFGRCGLFTARRGKVTFLHHDVESDGEVLVPGPGPCTGIYDLREPPESVVGGGLTLRHGDLPLRVSPQPQFLLGGPGAARVIGARLLPKDGDSRTPLAMSLAGRKLTLKSPTPLSDSHSYKLTLSVSSGDQPQDLSLVVTGDAPSDLIEVLLIN